jgi:Tfp pilus assembly protein PilX
MTIMTGKHISKQHGATLFVVLVMLVVLTLFAVSAINLSNLNMKAVGNMQSRRSVDNLAQTAIERTLTTSANFYSPAAAVAVPAPSGMTATVAPRVCLGSEAATGYSLSQSIVPEDNTWEIKVTVSDSVTSASAVMYQGAKIRMLANNCPN